MTKKNIKIVTDLDGTILTQSYMIPLSDYVPRSHGTGMNNHLRFANLMGDQEFRTTAGLINAFQPKTYHSEVPKAAVAANGIHW